MSAAPGGKNERPVISLFSEAVGLDLGARSDDAPPNSPPGEEEVA